VQNMKAQIAALMVTVFAAISAPVFAQHATPEVEKLKIHKWDVGGSLGILAASRSATDGFASSRCSCDIVTWAGNFDVGRYVTPHLKAEAGILWTSRRHFNGSDDSYPRTFPITYTMRAVDPTSISASFTYQFFENVFAHPYVSAGIRVTLFSEQTRTEVYYPNFSVAPTVTTSSRKFTQARPFVAAGYKSYFSERLYMRPEVLMAFDDNGVSHGTVRLGFGFDF